MPYCSARIALGCSSSFHSFHLCACALILQSEWARWPLIASSQSGSDGSILQHTRTHAAHQPMIHYNYAIAVKKTDALIQKAMSDWHWEMKRREDGEKKEKKRNKKRLKREETQPIYTNNSTTISRTLYTARTDLLLFSFFYSRFKQNMNQNILLPFTLISHSIQECIWFWYFRSLFLMDFVFDV